MVATIFGTIELMIISDEQLDAFIQLFQQEFNETPDRTTAHLFALKLVQLISIVYFSKRMPIQTTNDDMVDF